MDNQQYYGYPQAPQQQYYPTPPSKGSLLKKVLILAVVFALLGGIGALYAAQSSKISKLQTQVTGLQKDLADTKKQLEEAKTSTPSDEGTATSIFGLQQKARDTERNTDIKTLHGQIEAYYAQNGRYPTLVNMNDASWRSVNMKGLDAEALSDPSGKQSVLKASATKNSYSYDVKSSDDDECDNSTKDCAKYTLTASLEAGGTYTKSNLN